MTVTTTRILYDQDFLDAGCPEDKYDYNTQLDAMVGTWSTNFAIAFVCVLAFVRLVKRNGAVPSLSPFFLCVAVGFFVAGIGHIIIQSQEQELAKSITEGISALFVGSSTVLLVLSAEELLGVSRTGPKKWKKAVWWSTGVVSMIVVVYASVVVELLYISILGMVGYLVTAIICIVARPDLWYVKAIGAALLLAGFLVQAFLRGRCGDAGYQDCFRECPLPNPTVFNHNGLFHIVYMIGLMVLAVAEDRSRTPDPTSPDAKASAEIIPNQDEENRTPE